MPPLAAAKRRAGTALGSLATASESRQTMLCAYLSAALLVGLLANAIAGLWWADPAVALLIGTVALREARDAWRGHTVAAAADPSTPARGPGQGQGTTGGSGTEMRAPNLAGGGPEAESRGSRATQGRRASVVGLADGEHDHPAHGVEPRLCSSKRRRRAWDPASPQACARPHTQPRRRLHRYRTSTCCSGCCGRPSLAAHFFSPARERNFWLAPPFSISGATDGPGADDSGGAGHKGWPPAAPSAGGPVRAAGASSARMVHDSDRMRTPEDPVPRIAQASGHVGVESLPRQPELPTDG